MAKDTISEVSKWKTPLTELVPVNYGEFFTYSKWDVILGVIDAKLTNTQVVIPTNGAWLDLPVVNSLVRYRQIKIINFSVNAYLEETYEKFTGLPYFTVDKIRAASMIIRNKRPDITQWFSMVYDPLYQSEMEKQLFIDHWSKYGYPQIIPASNCGRSKLRITTTLPCRSIFSDLVIGMDRKISSCCFDARFSMDLGYLGNSVLDTWINQPLYSLRESHNSGRRKEIALCASCSFA